MNRPRAASPGSAGRPCRCRLLRCACARSFQVLRDKKKRRPARKRADSRMLFGSAALPAGPSSGLRGTVQQACHGPPPGDFTTCKTLGLDGSPGCAARLLRYGAGRRPMHNARAEASEGGLRGRPYVVVHAHSAFRGTAVAPASACMNDADLHILLIDQNVMRASVLEEGLKEAGYSHVTVVRNMQNL